MIGHGNMGDRVTIRISPEYLQDTAYYSPANSVLRIDAF